MDQRNIARVGATDIGAFETRGFTFALSSDNNQSAFVKTINATGIATTGTLTANSTVGGPYNVAATANGASPTINFALTNLNPPPQIVAAVPLAPRTGVIPCGLSHWAEKTNRSTSFKGAVLKRKLL